jgi:hypothetical protein
VTDQIGRSSVRSHVVAGTLPIETTNDSHQAASAMEACVVAPSPLSIAGGQQDSATSHAISEQRRAR